MAIHPRGNSSRRHGCLDTVLRGGGREMENRDSQVDKSRRKALKKIAVGAGFLAGCAVLPEKWITPVIGQIVLPAHAATSGLVLTQCTMNISSGNQGSGTITYGLTGAVTPPTAGVPIHIAITSIGGGADFTNFDMVTDGTGTYSFGSSFINGPGYTSVTAVVTSTVAAGTTTCSRNVPAAPVVP